MQMAALGGERTFAGDTIKVRFPAHSRSSLAPLLRPHNADVLTIVGHYSEPGKTFWVRLALRSAHMALRLKV
jgi:hypothetical protein